MATSHRNKILIAGIGCILAIAAIPTWKFYPSFWPHVTAPPSKLNQPSTGNASGTHLFPRDDEILDTLANATSRIIEHSWRQPENAVFNTVWYDSPWLFAAATMWRATHDRRYADMVCAVYDAINVHRADGTGLFDESRGRRIKSWIAETRGTLKTAPSWAAIMSYPALRITEEKSDLATLPERCRSTLMEIRHYAGLSLREFDNEFIQISDESGLYYNPFTMFAEPHNRQSAMIMAFNILSKDDPRWGKRAKLMLNWIASDFNKVGDGNRTHLQWTYAKPYQQAGLKGDTEPGEPISKGWMTLQMLDQRNLADIGSVIDLNLLANTFFEEISSPDGAMNRRTSRQGGFQPLEHEHRDHLLAWDRLSTFRPEIRTRLDGYVAQNPHDFPNGWLSGPHGTYVIALRRLQAGHPLDEDSPQTTQPQLDIRSLGHMPFPSFRALSAIGKDLIIAGPIGKLTTIFEPMSRNLVSTIDLDSSPTSLLNFREILLLGMSNGEIRAIDRKSGKAIWNRQITNSPIWALQIFADTIIAATPKGVFTINNSGAGEVYNISKETTWTMTYFPSSIITYGTDGNGGTLTKLSPDIFSPLYRTTNIGQGHAILSSGDNIAILSEAGKLSLYSATDLKPIVERNDVHPGQGSALTSTGRTLITGGFDGWIKFHTLPDLKPAGGHYFGRAVYAFAYAPDDETLYVGLQGGDLMAIRGIP